VCDQTKDFLGHVGGDDFLILFQSEDWEARIHLAMARFNAAAVNLYTAQDIEAGGIESEDRHGDKRFYSFVTIAVGVVPVCSGTTLDSSSIATFAAAAKREAKRSGNGVYICNVGARCCL
jgi:GGDEF domain-containing protein